MLDIDMYLSFVVLVVITYPDTQEYMEIQMTCVIFGMK